MNSPVIMPRHPSPNRTGTERNREGTAAAFQFFWSDGGATKPPIEEVASRMFSMQHFDGEQCFGARFRPEVPCPSQSKENAMRPSGPEQNVSPPDIR